MHDSSEFKKIWANYINGRWTRERKRELFPVINPATADTIAEIQLAGDEDIDEAVEAAKDCHQSRALIDMPPVKRAELMNKIALHLESLTEEIALAECLDNGKNIDLARAEAPATARYYRYYAGMVDKLEGKTIPIGSNFLDYTSYEPYGVSAQVVPWNYPLQLAARSASCALATANAVVMKSPELSPTSVTYLAEAYERAGAPKAALNICCGIGHSTGAKLVSHPDIDHIAFTGSVETGKSILRAASDNIIPSIIELGGKSAAVVYKDADIDTAVEDIVAANTINAGQICSACSRVLIEESIYDEVLEKIAGKMKSLSIGPGIEKNWITPVISEGQMTKILSFFDLAEKSNAQKLCGGKRHEKYTGYFIEPSLYAPADQDNKLAQEEIFGPVLTAIKFNSAEEAVELANATEYGLVAGVYTHNLDLALWTSRRMEAGQVFVNSWFAGGIETPFGGFKKSGFGREKGVEALYGYVQTKNTAVKISGQ